MTSTEIDAISIKLGIIAGIIYYIIYAVSSYFLRKKATQRIKDQLQEDEYIVLEPKTTYGIDIVIPFGVGGFIGVFILPFFLYPEIQHIKGYMGGISREYLPLCIIAILIVTLAYFWIGCMKFVLTNKRMIYAWAFKSLYKFINVCNKFDFLYYSNIKNFVYETYLMTRVLYVYTKDNKRFPISGFKNLDDFGSIIEKYQQ